MGFILGSKDGDAAYTVVAVAATPLFAALWSWILYRERADRPTLIAMAIGFLAVCLGAYEVVEEGQANLTAILAATSIPIGMGLGFTLTRYLPEGPEPVGALCIFRAVYRRLSLLIWGGLVLPETEKVPAFLISIFIVSALAFVLISIGPRYISAAQTSLMLLLETALSPFGFFLIGISPGPLTLIAGADLDPHADGPNDRSD